MKILIYSPTFYPAIGGLEMVMLTLANQFISEGHQVKVICLTQDKDNKEFPFEIIRLPKPSYLLDLLKWSDIYFQGCISLKGIWPLIFVHRPLVVTHQTWYARSDGSESWQDKLKKLVTNFAVNVSVSDAIAKNIWGRSIVIPNPYRDDIFYEMPEIKREKELVFLGRFVSDKGADMLIKALAKLKEKGLTPNLTMIGKGPEEERLRQLTYELNVANQVEFIGVKLDQELARTLNEHKIMVVPSIWKEPFGIVALEGIACGCVITGSEGGGLKDAIGACGVTFPNGNLEKLVDCLWELLTNENKLVSFRQNASEHLARHTSKAIAKAYLNVFENALK